MHNKNEEDTPPLETWEDGNNEHPADAPDESDEAPQGPYDELSPQASEAPGPYDKLPQRAPMRRPQHIGTRRDITRTRLPYRRILSYLRGRRG